MKSKQVLTLLAALVVLLVLAWISGFFEGAPSTIETPQLSIETEDLRSITIRKGDDEVIVVRTGDGWMLRHPVEAEVDTATRSRLLAGLKNLEVESLVSSRSDAYDRYQVDSSQATYLSLEGDEPVELYVGKTGPDFQSRYIRIGGDDRVFLASGVPTAQASVDRWREKALWNYPKESITSVSVTTPESAYELNSAGEGWTLEHDGETSPADSAKVDRYLGRLASVRADGFLLDLQAAALADSVTHTVEVRRIDGSVSGLRIQKRESDAAAIVNDSDDVIKLYSYRVTNLTPEISELLPD